MEIQIKVFRLVNGDEKDVYKNTIKLPNGVSFPFNSVTESLRLLYPNCIIDYYL